MIREVHEEIILSDGGQRVIKEKENFSKRNLYKEAIAQCCFPNCSSGFKLETHHIIPISKGGDDTFENFIVLCQKCHLNNGLHSRWRTKRLSLYAYKIYMEDTILGSDSVDYSDEEFYKLLRNKVYGHNHVVKTLKEENRKRVKKIDEEGKEYWIFEEIDKNNNEEELNYKDRYLNDFN